MRRFLCRVFPPLVLLTNFGCTARTAPPAVGSTSDPGALAASTREVVTSDDAQWKLIQTAAPGMSWGGEGEYGYHLVREDVRTGRVLATVDVGTRTNEVVGNMTLGFGSVWLGIAKGKLLKVDCSTNEVTAVIRVAHPPTLKNFTVPSNDPVHIPRIAVGEGAVWVVVWGCSDLFRVDPVSGQVEKIRLGKDLGDPAAVAVDSGAVVVAHLKGDSRIDVRVDPRTKALTKIVAVTAPVSRTLPNPALHIPPRTTGRLQVDSVGPAGKPGVLPTDSTDRR